MRLNSALGEPANVFEHLCQTIAADIVRDIAPVTVTGVRPFGGNYDGGIEVKVRTADGWVFGLFRFEGVALGASVPG